MRNDDRVTQSLPASHNANPIEQEALGYMKSQAESAEAAFQMTKRLAEAAEHQAAAEHRTADAYERIATTTEKFLAIFAAMHGIPFSKEAIGKRREL